MARSTCKRNWRNVIHYLAWRYSACFVVQPAGLSSERMDRLWLVLEGGRVEGGRGEFRVVRRSIIDWLLLHPGQRMHHNRLHMRRGGLRFVRAVRGRVYFLPLHCTGACDVLSGASARARGGVALLVRSAAVMTSYRIVQRNVDR